MLSTFSAYGSHVGPLSPGVRYLLVPPLSTALYKLKATLRNILPKKLEQKKAFILSEKRVVLEKHLQK